MADGIITPCNVARSWHWFRQVTAPCNVASDSGIMTVNSPSGNTLQCDTWLWDHGWHAMKFAKTFAILEFYLVSILTISPQSTCNSAPVSEILSKSDHPLQKKMTSCRFSRWRISAILDFRDPIKIPNYITSYIGRQTIALNCLVFEKLHFFCILASRSKMADLRHVGF